MLLKVPAKTKQLSISQYDERARYDNHNLGFFSEENYLVISANLVKVLKCFTMLNSSLGSSPLSGTLNFSFWIAEVLVLELEVSSVATR